MAKEKEDSLEELLKPEKLGKMIEEQRSEERRERNLKVAKQVAQQIENQVESLREIRRREKSIKAQLQKMNDAIADYDKSDGDLQVLRNAGFYL